ncbi:MAG: NRDE family protein [Pseudomonadota bacterium]
MCLVVVALNARDDLLLVLAGNRDEFHARPTAPMGWREIAGVRMLAGQDLEAGGTWLGVAPGGRFATVTNYREGRPAPAGGPSRGELVPAWLGSSLDAKGFAAQLQDSAESYAPYNLLFGDSRDGELYYFSNRGSSNRAPGPSALDGGIHALSNHLLNTAWPKTERTSQRLGALVSAPDAPNDEQLFELLADREGAPDSELPDTGVGLAYERVLAPPFIVTERYGTRCSSVLTVSHQGVCRFVERSFDEHGHIIGQRYEQFDIEAAPGVRG